MQNTLQTLKNKRSSKKGFTLMEMLIVVAIIAILVAIAIPIFNAQLKDARDQVDAANARSAQSMAYTEYLLDDSSTKETKYYVAIDNDHNMTIFGSSAAPTSGTWYKVTIDPVTGKTSAEKNAA